VRRAAKIDANQNEIVKALRKLGASVWITSGLGKGAPDLVIGFRNKNYLAELKDGSKPPSARKLTDDEKEFHKLWYGQVAVIESVEQAIELITN
jgi:hypothetical protein